MAETTLTLARTAAAAISEAYPSQHFNFADGTIVSAIPGSRRILLAQFSQLDSAYKYAKLVSVGIGGGSDPETHEAQLVISQAGSADLSTVTWETQPQIDSATIGGCYISSQRPWFNKYYPFPRGPWPSEGNVIPPKYTAQEASAAARKILQAPTIAFWTMRTTAIEYTAVAYREGTTPYNSNGYTPFQLYVVLDPSVTIQNTVIAQDDAPRFGYMSPYEAHTFAWEFVSSDDTYTCAGDWTQASATFYYRNGASGSYSSIALTSANSVTLPASAFTVGSFQWYVTATDTDGRTTTSPVYTLTTGDSAPVATPADPVNTVEDGSKPILFKWSVSIDTGTTPTGADLQYSTDGSTWSDLASVSGSDTEYTAPANTFSAGTNFWRVRSYNVDGVAGNWSSAVQFISIAAPAAPVVSCDGKPFATISWQSTGQQAYKVEVDGKSYGPYFGTVKDFALPDYLSDGQHSASVSIQGLYGLWSNPGSVVFTVANVPGDSVSLSGKFDRDAKLAWTTDSQAADFYIYRDDVRIGHTAGASFADRFVLGSHSYYVINKLPGGYYTRSNVVTGTMRSCTRAVAAFSGGGWLEMPLSDDSETEENFAWSMVVSERHVTGSAWPVAEKSPYTDGSGSYRISFADVESGAAFEALRGQKVIVKSRGGNVAIGILSGYQKAMTNFYLTYIFTVQRCDWRDYVDAED